MSDYVLARRVLLDALQALGPQRAAVILCGAQAVYLHVGEDEFAVSPFTVDADLLIDPAQLLDEPILREAMEKAGFRLDNPPGIWRSREEVEVDFLVPDALGGAGRRAAKLGPPHGNEVARKVRGLEAASVDHAAMRLSALDAKDDRTFDVAVAGPAALLVAKLHKIVDRLDDSPGRVKDKDGLDVLRLLRAIPTERLAQDLAKLLQQDVSRNVTEEAVGYLSTLFGTTTSEGTQMAVRATELLEDPEQIAASCAALASELARVVNLLTAGANE